MHGARQPLAPPTLAPPPPPIAAAKSESPGGSSPPFRLPAAWVAIVMMAVLQLCTLGLFADMRSHFLALEYQAVSQSAGEQHFTVSATTDLADLDVSPPFEAERRRLSSAIHSVSTITAATTLTKTSSTVILCDTTSAAITVTLPDASLMSENSGGAYRRYVVINTGAAGNDCTVTAAGSSSIYATGLTITNVATSTGTSTGVITNTATSTGVITNTATSTGVITNTASSTGVIVSRVAESGARLLSMVMVS